MYTRDVWKDFVAQKFSDQLLDQYIEICQDGNGLCWLEVPDPGQSRYTHRVFIIASDSVSMPLDFSCVQAAKTFVEARLEYERTERERRKKAMQRSVVARYCVQGKEWF